MASIRYMNQSAPFWDFVASLEQQGAEHPSVAGRNNIQNQNNNEPSSSDEEGNNWGNAWSWGPWGWPGAGRGRWHEGPPPYPGARGPHGRHRGPHPPPPPHHEGPAPPEHEGPPPPPGPPGEPADPPESVPPPGPPQHDGPEHGGPRGRHGRHHGPGPHGQHHERRGGGRCGMGGRGGFRGPWGRRGMGPFNMGALSDFIQSQMFEGNNTENNGAREQEQDFKPSADVFDTEVAFVVHVSLPGAKKEDVAVNWDAEKSELSVAGVIHRPGDEELLKTLALDERDIGAFERKIRLGSRANPAHVDVDGISAKFEDGILMVNVPKEDKDFVEVRKVDIE